MRLLPEWGSGTSDAASPRASMRITPSAGNSTTTPTARSICAVMSTSPIGGTLCSVVGLSPRRAATMALVTKFLAPSAVIRPRTGSPPWIS